jgi:hypothetical protein
MITLALLSDLSSFTSCRIQSIILVSLNKYRAQGYHEIRPLQVSSVADPRSGAFLTLGKNQDTDSGFGYGMKIPDHISESLETMFWAKNT